MRVNQVKAIILKFYSNFFRKKKRTTATIRYLSRVLFCRLVEKEKSFILFLNRQLNVIGLYKQQQKRMREAHSRNWINFMTFQIVLSFFFVKFSFILVLRSEFSILFFLLLSTTDEERRETCHEQLGDLASLAKSLHIFFQLLLRLCGNSDELTLKSWDSHNLSQFVARMRLIKIADFIH